MLHRQLHGRLLKQNSTKTTTIGQQAEAAAAHFLQQQGVPIVARNYRCRYGEIDLIGTEDSLLIVIEVRLRNRTDIISGAETVTAKKQQRISQTTQHFLQHHPQYEASDLRFDVLSMRQTGEGYEIEWIQEAFWPGDN